MTRSLDDQTIQSALQALERRIAALEARLELGPEQEPAATSGSTHRSLEEEEDAIEQQIGQNWFIPDSRAGWALCSGSLQAWPQ